MNTRFGSLTSRVLLPTRLLRSPVKFCQLGKLREEDCETSSDSGSEANEYAEGLGCADVRRCSEVSSSGFAFDEHPREEYFEEPKSADTDMLGRMQELTAPRSAKKRPLSSVLLQLEAKEAREEAAKKQKDSNKSERETREPEAKRQKVDEARGQAAHLIRSCQSQATTSLQPRESEASQQVDSKVSVLAQLRAHCACLSVLRSRAEKVPAKEKDISSALKTLASLMHLEVGLAELKATGIGRELAKAAWKQHISREVSLQSQGLVAKWRHAAKAASSNA